MSQRVKWLANGQETRIAEFTETALFVPVPAPAAAVAFVTGSASSDSKLEEMVKSVANLLRSHGVDKTGLECKYICPNGNEDKLVAAINSAGFKAKGRSFSAKEQVEIWIRSSDQAIKVRTEDRKKAAEVVSEIGDARAKAAPAEAKKLRVLIVDDSATIRKILRKILSEIPGVAEVADVGDPAEAPEVIKSFKPDLMTLDINMPKMNGDVLLRNLGGVNFSVPTLILTSLNINESRSVMDCLEMGAFDYLHKPESGAMGGFKEELALRIELIRSRTRQTQSLKKKAAPRERVSPGSMTYNPDRLLVIGASTGGTEAIKNVLIHMPANISPTLIVQHIPPYFSRAFADRLNDLCEFEVKEAEDGDELRQNRVLVAPGDFQIKVVQKGGRWFVQTNKDPLMSGHRPSVDYMFGSVVAAKHPDVVAVLLTGMGKDGAIGMKSLRDAGFPTIAQDEATSVVYGMPKAAAMNGGAAKILGLDIIPDELMVELGRSRRKSA